MPVDIAAVAMGAQGNSTALVGTPETVAKAMLEYYASLLIRGYDPRRGFLVIGNRQTIVCETEPGLGSYDRLVAKLTQAMLPGILTPHAGPEQGLTTVGQTCRFDKTGAVKGWDENL